MPPVTGRRRKVAEISDDEDVEPDRVEESARSSRTFTNSSSPDGKRQRLSDNGEDVEEDEDDDEEVEEDEREEEGEEDADRHDSVSPLAPGSARAELSNGDHVDRPLVRDADGLEKHLPGSIVRVKLQNFVTYTLAEFFPGPSLNMVIGPNGTGKSTLVCAICLGLGWGPQHLGRAKDVAEFVKHGCAEASIEIELAGREGEGNVVIRRQIRREGNQSRFSIDRNVAPQKAVLELAKSFSIQIDNLCQFLPQDKVVEFAAMSPIELLHSTQRAAAGEQMLQWHEKLIALRVTQKERQSYQMGKKERLANMKNQQQQLRGDVERMRERAGIQVRVRMLEKSRPFTRYRQNRNLDKETKEKKLQATRELKRLEDDVEPSLRAANAKQVYANRIEKVKSHRKRAVERGEAACNEMVKVQKEKEDRIKELEKLTQMQRKIDKSRLEDVRRLHQKMKNFERLMAEDAPEFDPAYWNAQIREKTRQVNECHDKVTELKASVTQMASEGRAKMARVESAKKDLDNLHSKTGQQGNTLKAISSETARAWEWIQKNQDQFEHPVYGPPTVECSVKDPRYMDALESLMQKNDFTTFTVQSRADFEKLNEQLYSVMRLADITIRSSTTPLAQFRAPVSEEQMRSYGFDGWALDFLSGPEPVLAMLCGECRLGQTGVAIGEISEQQFEMLQDSPITSWITGKQNFQVTRRREYGPGATSTRVRDLQKARVWTDKPVDNSAEQEIQRNIQEWTDEVAELKTTIQELSDKGKETLRTQRDLEREKADLEKDKASKQNEATNFRALPTKLAQAQETLSAKEEEGAEIQAKLEEYKKQSHDELLAKGKHAVEYAGCVEKLAQLHNELLEAEIMLVEATSEFDQLTARNRDVKQMLKERQREVELIKREADKVNADGRVLLTECRRILSNEEDGEAQKEFMGTLPDDMTPDGLEMEIEAEKARLEMVHEGNPNAIREYDDRQRTIDKLSKDVEATDEQLEKMGLNITKIRERWEPQLDRLVEKISEAFAENFRKIGCAGSVGVAKEEDFDQWAIEIRVKFREHEPLTLLDSHRQSGGERAVSTIFYLMSLQSLALAPFRVVDEINQGMDPRNERMVHERMVDIACREHTSQYFLITPKLLHGLKYHERMRVLCIASGEFVPPEEVKDKDEGALGGRELLDFGKALVRRQRLNVVRASA